MKDSFVFSLSLIGVAVHHALIRCLFLFCFLAYLLFAYFTVRCAPARRLASAQREKKPTVKQSTNAVGTPVSTFYHKVERLEQEE
jgi:hypothetical protein